MALIDVFADTVTRQLAIPVQAPPHPPKVESLSGLAVSVTFVPLLKVAVQLFPQLMPAGELVIVPVPGPETCIVTWKELGPLGGGDAAMPPPQPESKMAKGSMVTAEPIIRRTLARTRILQESPFWMRACLLPFSLTRV